MTLVVAAAGREHNDEEEELRIEYCLALMNYWINNDDYHTIEE